MVPAPPKGRLIEPLWPLIVSAWGILEVSWGSMFRFKGSGFRAVEVDGSHVQIIGVR